MPSDTKILHELCEKLFSGETSFSTDDLLANRQQISYDYDDIAYDATSI